MAKSSLRLRRTPGVDRVGFLEDVFFRQLPDVENVYISYPAESGPQPCIIEVREGDGGIKRMDALTILPLDAPADQVAGGSNLDKLLSLLGSAQKAAIARLKDDEELMNWTQANWNESPFCSQKAGKWTPPLFQIGVVSHDSKRKWQRTKRRKKQWKEERAHKEASPGENWWVIEQWAGWENAKLIWRIRYETFQKNFGRDATFNGRKDYDKKVGKFRHQCSFLRLKCSVRENAQAAKFFRQTL